MESLTIKDYIGNHNTTVVSLSLALAFPPGTVDDLGEQILANIAFTS